MQLSIVGCPDKKLFRPYVKRAILFYAENLFSKKMSENVFLQVKFNAELDVYGYASVEECNNSGKPREFLVEINSEIGAPDILKTIAHEMVHVKQFLYGETNESLTRWKGMKISSDTNYYCQPWEIEAHGMEVSLFSRFAIKEKLWDVFEGVNNPDGPVKQTDIGWKESFLNSTL